MKVKEKLIGLFSEIETTNPNSEIFDFVDSTTLDLVHLGMFGERVLSSIAEAFTIEQIGIAMSGIYLHKWNQIILSYLESENLLLNYEERTIETNNDVLNNETARTTTNKVSPYNEDLFTNKEEEGTTESSELLNNRNKETVTTRIKDSDVYNKVQQYLMNFNIYELMMKDVNSMLLLLIVE